MKSMVRQLIAVTFGLCLSMLFSICSFASTGYPWFQVPNNNTPHTVRLTWYDSSNAAHYQEYTPSSGGVVYISKPSNFDSTYNSTNGCRISIYCYRKGSAYYGITLYNSTVYFIDSNPGQNNLSTVCWANSGYGSNHKYSMQSVYTTPGGTVRFGQIMIYHPNGDGGTAISSSDFPITFKINSYVGQFNYAGIPDDGVYNATTINSNKANSAINLGESNAEDISELELRVSAVETDLSTLVSGVLGNLQWLTRNLTVSYSGAPEGQTWTDSQGGTHTYQSYDRYTYSIQNEHVVKTTERKSGTFFGILLQRIKAISDFIELQAEVYFQWFYPLKDANPQYWHVYNTDTDSTDVVNPATVTYYITWYLGQLFLMNNDNTPLGNLQDSVDDIKDQLVTVESQEQSIITSIRNGIDNFNPDLSQIGSFRALSWCSNYLQQIYVSLGTYGTVILIGLLLGVCMQFIGYFRYK